MQDLHFQRCLPLANPFFTTATCRQEGQKGRSISTPPPYKLNTLIISLLGLESRNLHHILTNKFYTGHFVFRGLHRVGHHTPIVSMDTFNQVQRQLKAGNKPSYDKPEIAFAHLITCGHCGCSVIGDSKQQGRYIYYRCTHFKQKCPDKYIREEKLTEQFEYSN